jgi:HAD superfamily hydrolase (TIGR01509 family)
VVNTSDLGLAIQPHAILWDMDGTIVDSEAYWIVAEIELVELFGGSWTHADGLSLVGNGLPVTAEKLQQHGVKLSIDEIIQALTNRVLEQLEIAVPWRPGAVELIHQFQAAGIPQALVTMSIERMARAVVAMIPGVPLTEVVAGDNVLKSKPDPEAYVLAAEKLDVDISHCVAFEDSPSGCRSAISSGAVTIGVTNLVNLDGISTDITLESLVGVSAPQIFELFAAKRGQN